MKRLESGKSEKSVKSGKGETLKVNCAFLLFLLSSLSCSCYCFYLLISLLSAFPTLSYFYSLYFLELLQFALCITQGGPHAGRAARRAGRTQGGFAPVQRAQVQRAQVQRAPVQRAPVQRAPVQRAQVQRAQVQRAPVQRAPVQRAQVQVNKIRKVGELEK